ncbi:hypothetical protein PENSUB_8667 [Penicillium subrubescens]|uniref:Uncharacterized protein n=1 Tax=Penicillium subrubescens TaxID=1316194 RepID=A0A1Q5TGD6_9EURO|nr:hypothetical protein PENSUB_8667 [Penicillium subrubescens]
MEISLLSGHSISVGQEFRLSQCFLKGEGDTEEENSHTPSTATDQVAGSYILLSCNHETVAQSVENFVKYVSRPCYRTPTFPVFETQMLAHVVGA